MLEIDVRARVNTAYYLHSIYAYSRYLLLLPVLPSFFIVYTLLYSHYVLYYCLLLLLLLLLLL